MGKGHHGLKGLRTVGAGPLGLFFFDHKGKAKSTKEIGQAFEDAGKNVEHIGKGVEHIGKGIFGAPAKIFDLIKLAIVASIVGGIVYVVVSLRK